MAGSPLTQPSADQSKNGELHFQRTGRDETKTNEDGPEKKFGRKEGKKEMSTAELMLQDSLRSLRSNFYLGLWQPAIKEIESIRRDGDASLRPSADAFYFRILERLKPELLEQEIQPDSSTPLQAVKLLADYRGIPKESHESMDRAKQKIFATLSEWLSFEEISGNPILRLIAAQLHFEEGHLKDALELIKDSHHNLEQFVSPSLLPSSHLLSSDHHFSFYLIFSVILRFIP